MFSDRIVPTLLRTYRAKIVSPVIVESRPNKFIDVSAMLKDIVPINLLQAKFNTIFPRIRSLIEFPFAKWKEINRFSMIATVLTPRLIEEVAQWREVRAIYPDYIKWAISTVPEQGIFKDYRGEQFTSTYWTKRMLGLDRANDKGYTGRGIITAVVDTGARVTHPMLRRVVTLTASPEKGMSGQDNNGHGTWCTSCVGGAYIVDKRYNVPIEGMAPECRLISIQSLGFIIGAGTSSDIIKGMEIALSSGAKVVSMSLGSDDAPKDKYNPEARAIDNLVDNGVIPVVAAGNSGPYPKSIGSPGCCLNSLTVGSISPFTGEVSRFSSRGPTFGDGYIKPDVVAPGERINSALIGFLDHMTDPTQRRFGPISGTSMATPHVAGLITCMAQAYASKLGKELTVDEVKTMMNQLGHPKNNDEGWGLITWDLVEQWVNTQYGITL